ncbi:MAG: thioredoxin family protein [Patescibacteria group bacterium]|nr:thioredoxin family protein [Patescibacteria group bacterium]MCL5261685.1 thioredoxin family protein [Patescibacteria group bacterium]
MEQTRRQLSLFKFAAAFAISFTIFIAGFALSNRLSQSRLQDLQNDINSLQSEYSSLEMLTLMDKTSNVSCEMYEEQIVNFANETDTFGQKLELVASRLPEQNAEVVNMKTNYWLMEIRDFFTLKQIATKCNKKYTTVLYFFDRTCEDCGYEGEMLRQVKQEYPEIMIYSFDVSNKDISLIKILSQIYNIKNTPTLIIGDKKIEKEISRQELNSILGIKSKPLMISPETKPTETTN